MLCMRQMGDGKNRGWNSKTRLHADWAGKTRVVERVGLGRGGGRETFTVANCVGRADIRQGVDVAIVAPAGSGVVARAGFGAATQRQACQFWQGHFKGRF